MAGLFFKPRRVIWRFFQCPVKTMKISSLIAQLRDQCPTPGNRIGTGIDLTNLQANTPLQTPCAYVVPVADLASKSVAQNLNLQPIRDNFEVTLVYGITDAKKARDLMHELRAELWLVLAGFKPGSDYEAIAYDGGKLVSINSNRSLYCLRFFTEFQLGRNLPGQSAESWQDRELDGLSSFPGGTVRVDAIYPVDPNLKRPGLEERLERTFSGDVPHEQSQRSAADPRLSRTRPGTGRSVAPRGL